MLAEILFWSFVAASDRERRRLPEDEPAAATATSFGCEDALLLMLVSFFRTDILPTFPDLCRASLHAQQTH